MTVLVRVLPVMLWQRSVPVSKLCPCVVTLAHGTLQVSSSIYRIHRNGPLVISGVPVEEAHRRSACTPHVIIHTQWLVRISITVHSFSDYTDSSHLPGCVHVTGAGPDNEWQHVGVSRSLPDTWGRALSHTRPKGKGLEGEWHSHRRLLGWVRYRGADTGIHTRLQGGGLSADCGEEGAAAGRAWTSIQGKANFSARGIGGLRWESESVPGGYGPPEHLHPPLYVRGVPGE